MRKWRISVVLAALAVISWMTWILATSYVRAPKLVEELEHAGMLPFSPSELPRGRLCALLAVQDRTFFRHQGIGIADGPAGHTTLTQAIAKGLFFDGFTPGLLHQRKIRLMLTAWAFDRQVPKETQLRIFLNRAYFGGGNGREVLGFPAAAAAFYHKPLNQLSDEEYLGLLAMLAAPVRYHVLRRPEANRERVAWIRRMVKLECREGCFQGDAPVPCAASE